MCSILNYCMLYFPTVYIFCTGHKSGLPRFSCPVQKTCMFGKWSTFAILLRWDTFFTVSQLIPAAEPQNVMWMRPYMGFMADLCPVYPSFCKIFLKKTRYLPDIQSIYFGSSISINVIFYSVQVKLWRKEKIKVDCYRKVKCVLIILDRPENWLM